MLDQQYESWEREETTGIGKIDGFPIEHVPAKFLQI